MLIPSEHSQGIYIIRCTINGKVYVGQGASPNGGIRGRGLLHIRRLRKGQNSPHLQAAWDKYGEEAFTFEVLKICPIEECNYWENHYIDIYQSWNRDKGYNIERYARGTGLVSDETRRKIRLKLLPLRGMIAKKCRIWYSNHPEFIEETRARYKAMWADPIKRSDIIARIKASLSSPEARAASRERAIELQNRPEVKEKLRSIKLGRVWCNDGTHQKFVKPEDIPGGWVRGCIHTRVKRPGRRYYTHPLTGDVIRVIPGNQPDGYVLGCGLKRSKQYTTK